MATISMDGMDQAIPRPRPHSTRRSNAWNGPLEFLNVAPRNLTELGFYLTEAYRAAGYPSIAQLAEAADVAGSTMTRIMYGEVKQPRPAILDRIADALVQPTLHTYRTEAEKEKARENARIALREAAGYNMPPVGRRIDPLALEVDRMIGEGSPLPPERIQYLRTMLDHLLQADRKYLRRQTG